MIWRLHIEGLRESGKAGDDVSKLKAQREAVSRKISQILELTGDESMEEAKVKIADLKREKLEIDQRLAQTKQLVQQPIFHVDALVESLVDRLAKLGTSIHGMPVYQLRQVLATMTLSLTADMLTREVEMTIRVPGNALGDVETAIESLCLQQHSGSSIVLQTHTGDAPILATIHCEHQRDGGKPCYTCRRVRRAA